MPTNEQSEKNEKLESVILSNEVLLKGIIALKDNINDGVQSIVILTSKITHQENTIENLTLKITEQLFDIEILRSLLITLIDKLDEIKTIKIDLNNNN